jgi:5-methylcytosine-specific restriction enzyme subunit McrC
MISYAKATRCAEAFLIYPTGLKEPLDITASDIRVRSLTFSLDGDLHQAGQSLLKDLPVLA